LSEARGDPSVHASAVLVGARALLIRGPSGSGKSKLVLNLLAAARGGSLSFVRLIGDDRVHLEAVHGRLLVRPAPEIAGLVEVRGLGPIRLPFEPLAVVGCVVDLADPEAQRFPEPAERSVTLGGVTLPRIALPACADPLGVLLPFLRADLS
jgi:HPr kinase/phosphorylase